MSLVHEWFVEEHAPKGWERKGGSGVRAGACPGLAPGGDVYVMRGVGPLSRHGRMFGRRFGKVDVMCPPALSLMCERSMERSPTDVVVKLEKVLLAARPDCRHVHIMADHARRQRRSARRERASACDVRVTESARKSVMSGNVKQF